MSTAPILNFLSRQSSWLGWRVGLIIATALVIYLPVLHGTWIADDVDLLSDNSLLHTTTGLWFIWFGHYTDSEWPLTWTFAWVITQIFGSSPLAFHLANIILHLVSAFLFWSLLSRFGLKQAWLGALLFVVHPTTVESVAWMSEIKNALSLPFYLCALHCWLDFEEGRGRFRYALTFLLYLAAMLSKTSVVMLPFVLLLISWWKRGHLRVLDFGKILPFLLLAILLGISTIHNQGLDQVDPTIKSRSFPARIGQVGASAFFYLGKFFWPAVNTPIYPKWRVDPPNFLHLLMAGSLAGVFLFLLIFRRQDWARGGLLGLGFFLLNLVPVLGMANMIFYHVSWVADYLSYIPCLGLIGLSVAGYEFALEHLPSRGRVIAYGLLASVVVGCVVISRTYASKYKNGDILWEYAFELNPHSLSTERIYAAKLLKSGRDQESIDLLRSMVKDHPEDDESRWTLAEALSDLPATRDEGEAEYQKLLLRPDLKAFHHSKLAAHFMKLGKIQEAIAQYRWAIQMEPLNVDAHGDLGYALMQLPGQQDEALAEYTTALRLDPTDPLVHNNLGYAYSLMPDRLDQAQTELQLAVAFRPAFVTAHNNLGNVWAKKGRWDNAIVEYQLAVQLGPDDPVAYRNLAYAYGQVYQRWPDAIQVCQELVGIQPDNPDNYTLLGNALAGAGRYDEACQAYEKVLSLNPNDPGAARNLSALRERTSHF